MKFTYLKCSRCGKQVSTALSYEGHDIVVRAWIECPECIEAAEKLQSVIHWIPVSERLPEDLEAGDRILLVLNERHTDGKFRLEVTTLVATEYGWRADDETYSSYTPEDGVYWVKEKDILPAPPASEEGEG